MGKEIQISGITEGTDEVAAAIFRSKLMSAYRNLVEKIGTTPTICIGTNAQQIKNSDEEASATQANSAKSAMVQDPLYTFDQLILPKNTYDAIIRAAQVLSVEDVVFNQWGLRRIEPHPKAALNFFGPPGTGKTLAAHAIASFLGKKIMIASYAEIESKYHGEGPKNVKKIFQDAEKEDAVLFIDEADSLLSKRLTNVTQGAEQAINSMRSQLLICLEQFHGVVVFATNLIKNYDKAFETRIQHVEFVMPDKECRKKIWQQHLLPGLPLDADVSIEVLAEIDGVCGRDIRNVVIQTAIRAALNKSSISLNGLQSVLSEIKQKQTECNPESEPLSDEDKEMISKKVGKAVAKYKEQRRTNKCHPKKHR